MSKAGAQVLIKNIIREIAQECATKGQVVSETLVAFIVCPLIKCVLFIPQSESHFPKYLSLGVASSIGYLIFELRYPMLRAHLDFSVVILMML